MRSRVGFDVGKAFHRPRVPDGGDEKEVLSRGVGASEEDPGAARSEVGALGG